METVQIIIIIVAAIAAIIVLKWTFEGLKKDPVLPSKEKTTSVSTTKQSSPPRWDAETYQVRSDYCLNLLKEGNNDQTLSALKDRYPTASAAELKDLMKVTKMKWNLKWSVGDKCFIIDM